MGFGIRVEFLCGRYTASAFNDRGATEWPPHWARVFYALVDAWGFDDSPADGRQALVWLESLGNPEIFASTAVSTRSPVTHYVPDNDVDVTEPSKYQKRYEQLASALEAGDANKIRRVRNVGSMVNSVGRTPEESAEAMLPERRGRHERFYPTVRPSDPVVTYWWPKAERADGGKGREHLEALLSQVVRLGHSSSFVALTSVDVAPSGSAWRPADGGELRLRSVRPGLLELLERDYSDHQASRPRFMRSVTVGYRAPRNCHERPAQLRATNAGPWRVFGLVDPANPQRPSTAPGRLAAQLTVALRGAVLAHAPDPRLGLISGHAADGSPLTRPHAAYLALPNVGHDRSTGAILGLAIMIPDGTPQGEEQVLDSALGAWSGLLGRDGRWRVGRANPALATLDPKRWARPSNSWVTATPVALGRFPAGLRRGAQRGRGGASTAVLDAAEDDIRAACGHIGLPEPLEVRVSLTPLLDGSLPVRAYPPFTRGGVRRALVHAAITFAVPIAGPLVLGSGRYLGLGLCLPLPERSTR